MARTLLTFVVMLLASVNTLFAQSKWDGKTLASGIATGSGTADNPYLISSAAEFAYFGSKMSGNSQYWKLTEDIDLDGNEWTYGSKNTTFKGHFDGNGHTVSNVVVKAATANQSYGLFCTIDGPSANNHAEVKNLKIVNVSVTMSLASVGATTNIGSLAGKAGKYVDVTNVSVSGTNSIHYTGVITSTNNVGGLIGLVSDMNTAVKACSVSGMSISVDGNINNVNLGGLVGNTSKSVTIQACSTNGVSISAGVDLAGSNYIGALVGSFAGSSGNISHLNDCKVSNGSISLNGNVTSTTYVGGAVGFLNGYAQIDGVTVNGGSINGPSATKTITNGKLFYVGGMLGCQNSTGTNAGQPNMVKNVAVSGININMANYKPATVINNHKFAVGGVIGTVYNPQQADGVPENLLFKGGKIYAPYAATSPTVGNFNASAASYNNYTVEVVGTADAVERSKGGSWLYSDYQLGLSSDLLSNTLAKEADAAAGKSRRNYASTEELAEEGGVKYLTVKEGTFERNNRYLDGERTSKTVLWWTRSDNNASYANNNLEQNLYPQTGNGTAGMFDSYPHVMYYYQGVNVGTYTATEGAQAFIDGLEQNYNKSVKSLDVTAPADPVVLTLTNDLEGKRGFDERTITVAASQNEADVTSSYTYDWYVNGVKQTGNTSTLEISPDWRNGKGIVVNAKDSEDKIVASASYTLKVGVMKTKDAEETVGSAMANRGTKDNPYVIDSEEALRQFSMLTTSPTVTLWEGLAKPASPLPTNQVQGHYNRAYYELGDDIELSDDDFTPVSHAGTSNSGSDGTYTQNMVFQGHFDGKHHKIGNMHITWGAGRYNGNGVYQYHGLFGVVGNPTATQKWGEGSVTSPTVIRNLKIEGAVLTHDTDNTSFYYNNGTSGNSNNCMVGVLAGIVAGNTTIENIEVHNSKITDEGSSTYSLATRGLYVGGVIGSMQTAFNAENNVPANVIVRNIVAKTDITIEHAEFFNASQAAQLGVLNVGGIVGRFCATSATQSAVQAVLPSNTLFSGTIKAPKAWISPVVAAVRFSLQQTVNANNFSKIWEANNNTEATQLKITNASYYNFKIYDGDSPKLISDNYPVNTCNWGARSVVAHTNANEPITDYDARKFQGVNFNAKYITGTELTIDPKSGQRYAIAMLNEGLDNQGVLDAKWVWNDEYEMPTMEVQSPELTTQSYVYLTRGTDTEANRFVVNTNFAAPTYTWYKYNKTSSQFEQIGGADSYAYIATPDKVDDLYIMAKVQDGTSEFVNTQILIVKSVPMVANFRITRTLNANGTDFDYAMGSGEGDDPIGENSITYQWYKADGTTPFAGATNDGLTLTPTEKDNNAKVYCLVTITNNAGDVLFTQTASYFNKGKVVYMMLSNANESVTASNGKTYLATSAGANAGGYTYDNAEYGRTPDKPVNSWAGAYALLDAYTPAAISKGGYNNAQIKIDDSKNLVTVDDNIIVVMGLAKDKYFDSANTNDGTVANKPATVTGKWDGVDYHGCIGLTTEHMSINADHKYEYIGFSKCGTNHYRLYAHRWNVHMGKGLLMGYEAGLAAGKDDATNYTMDYADPSTGTPIGHRASDIAVMGGYLNEATNNNPEKNEFVNHGRTEGQYIILESGLWGPVCPGNRQTDQCISYFMMGGPENPAKTTIIVDMDREWNDAHRQYRKGDFATVDVGCLLTGNHEGSMYADVVLDIRSGKMGRVVNGIKGSQRVYGLNTGFKTDGNYRHIVRNIDSNGDPVSGSGVGTTAGSGTKWIYTSAPAPDSYIGRGVINISPAKAVNYTAAGSINDRVSVVELYCGSLGRCHNTGVFHPEVATSFFGQTIVNIEGGTFYNTIYGAGAGGVNGIGTDDHHTDDNAIPFYKDGNKNYVWYAPYEYLKETNNLGNIVEVSYHNNETLIGRDGTAMPTDGTIDLRDTYSYINITGGVFGSEASPVSIYAGGSGETDDALINMAETIDNNQYIRNSVQTPSHQAGCFFGSGNGVASEIRIKNATVYGNIYGGGKGTAKYYRWISLAPSATTTPTSKTAFEGYAIMNAPTNYANYLVEYTKKLRSNADNYLNLGQVYGDTKITIGDNTVIHGNVFGGGEGVADMAKADFIAGTGMALTLDNASLNISNMTDEKTTRTFVTNIAEKDYISFPNMGKVFGKAQVNIESNAVVHGNVYGGGDAGSIQGVKDAEGNVVGNPVMAESSEVNIKDMAEIYGSVFGAGRGLTQDNAADYKEVATITGNTRVNLTGGVIWQNVYGGGENAVVNGSTNFNMTAGSIAANVYGGGMGNVNTIEVNSTPTTVITSADVSHNTNVNITGGKIIWDRSSLSGEQEVDVTVYKYIKSVAAQYVTGEEYESSFDNTADKVQATYTALNYTGVTVTAQSTQTKTVDDVVYYLWNVNYTIPAHDEFVTYDHPANPQGYTYVGTETEKRKLVAGQVINWNINDPSSAYYDVFYNEDDGKFNIEHNIFGGGYLACNVGTYDNEGHLTAETGKAVVNLTQGLFGMDLMNTRQWQTAYNDNENPHFYVFGGGYGIHTKVAETDVDVNIQSGDGSVETDEQLAKPRKSMSEPGQTEELPIISDAYGQSNATVLGVLGGGYNGWVGTTDVKIDGKTYIHRVYGGGLGSYEGWVEAGKPATIGAMTDVTGYVGITENTKIEVAGGNVYGDVFGGGAGVAPNSKEGSLTDYTEIARTTGDTHVIISDDAQVFGKVYGGGDVANVTGNTLVDAVGGEVFGALFGGGSGRKRSEAVDYTSVGGVGGNTNVHIYNNSDDERPSLYGDVYGGCAYGVVGNHANVVVDGGYIGNNIFGGGYGSVDTVLVAGVKTPQITSANITRNTNVQINGGSYMWKTIADVNGRKKFFDNSVMVPLATVLEARTNPYALVPYLMKAEDFFDYKKEHLFMNVNGEYYDHNIYGGGNVACTVGGTTNVNMYHGMLDDELGNADDPNWRLGALLRFMILDNKQHPQFAVFGGGYGINTVTTGDANVNIQIGKKDAMKGNDDVDPSDDQYIAYEKDTQTWNTFYSGLQTKFNALSTDVKNTLYGGTSGANSFARYMSSRMCQTFGVPNHTVLYVAGGGFAGNVDGNTNVNISNHSGALSVFGGGIGMMPANPTGDEAYGQVKGNATVNIGGGVISRNVYGGGAGIESALIGDEPGVMTDFVNMARVVGTTNVTIDGYATGTLVYGKVFGGGDVANVFGAASVGEINKAGVAAATPDNSAADAYAGGYATDVTVKGGLVFQEVFAGGSGRTIDVCSGEDGEGVYGYQKLGAVYGNSRVTINSSVYTAEEAELENTAHIGFAGWTDVHEGDSKSPWLWANVYGGGENGLIYGNSDVQIKGGNLGYDVFGGGLGNVTNFALNDEIIENVSSADVKGNTNVNVTGGDWCISQMWNKETRMWYPANKDDSGIYSSQYSPVEQKFLINHNVYGGGNIASEVQKSYVNMTKGLISNNAALGHDYPSGQFFSQSEWQHVYDKHASPHFAVFGGGFGRNTNVADSSYVNVNMSGDADPADNAYSTIGSTNFTNYQSVMDVIGGGYEGRVTDCNVTVDGKTFMRNIFGGAYYADVKTTNVTLLSGNLDDIYGGGMMGDVRNQANVTVGSEANDNTNSKIMVLGNIYGANDVSGFVGAYYNNEGVLDIENEDDGVSVTLLGGHVAGNVYGGGNGNYLYMIDPTLDQNTGRVTAYEDYEVNGEKRLVYGIPMRDDMGSFSSSNEVQRVINISTYRPVTIHTSITLKGNAAPTLDDTNIASKDFLLIDGNVFGGGNSATISNFAASNDVAWKNASAELNIGSNIKVGSVFLGSDGEKMFAAEASNTFIRDFPTLNNLTLSHAINWDEPENSSFPDKYMTVAKKQRPDIYKNMLDLYFLPVEMGFVPKVYWGTGGGKLLGNTENVGTGTLNNVFIGTFCCGGNRGNMTTADRVDLVFPEGLTITDKIVGGCNNANYQLGVGTANVTEHIGGYLYGTHELGYDGSSHASTNPQIRLVMKNKFVLKEQGGEYQESANVYGGCYQSGNIRGDIEVDMRSDMLKGNDVEKIRSAFEARRSVASIYGGGYGTNTYVYGDTRVTLGRGVPFTNESQASVYNVFGGGQQGNVVGTSNVQIINGHVGGNVVGGSYAGYLYGSTNVLVGFPRFYVCQETGEYQLLRKDNDPTHLAYVDEEGNPYIKQSIKLLKGAGVSKAIIDEIIARDGSFSMDDDGDCVKGGKKVFIQISDRYQPQDYGLKWTKININVDRAIYGGGYSLASGSSVGAGAKTVKKLTDDYNLDEYGDVYGLTGSQSTVGYGGNTNVMICDLTPNNVNTESTYLSAHDNSSAADKTADCDVDHITLSTGVATEIPMTDGKKLFGLYYKSGNTYIYVNNPEATYPYKPHVGKNDATEEEARAIKYYRYTGEGGLFGDGHLSLSEGLRFGEITRYGYAGTSPIGAKLMNCIHRFDIARVKDCCMSLMGDRDYVAASTSDSDANNEPYSIARVGELQLVSSIADDAVLSSGLERDETALTYTVKRSRNYVGLSSNVRNLGAIYSDVPMNANRHKANGTLDTDATVYGQSSDMTYQGYKSAVIADGYDYTKHDVKEGHESEFVTRNDATARNLIGIASGLALVVQDAAYPSASPARANRVAPDPSSEVTFYGPLKGVVEVSLINLVPGEAGGYVYAQNNHEGTDDHFLQLEGNVVYPISSLDQGRKVVDDCYPDAYKSGAEGHYWYVTGYNYVYNAYISAYTSNNTSPALQFNMKYNLGYVRLSDYSPNKTYSDNAGHTNVPYNKTIKIKSFRFLPHSGDTPCDIEDKFLGDDTSNALAGTGYSLKLMLRNDAGGYEPDVVGAIYQELTTKELTTPESRIVLGEMANDEPYVALCLVDNVANNDADVDAEHRTYLEKYLSEPCNIELVLEVPDELYNTSGYEAKAVNETYTYTINVTMKYIQGPNYNGHVDRTCALPGEMICLSKENLEIITDEISMPKIAEKWEFGPVSALADGTNVIDPVDGLSFEIDKEHASGEPGAGLSKAFYDKTDDKVYIPAYYFMNGYGVQYSFKVQGIDDFIPVRIDPTTNLLVHNYHRMKGGYDENSQFVDTQIRKAAVAATDAVPTLAKVGEETDEQLTTRQTSFAAQWAKYHPLPRVYIEDAEDMAAFKTYLADGGNDKGAGVDFHLMRNVEYGSWSALDFKGNFHGNGNMLTVGNTLFGTNSGNIHNLGILNGNIANSNAGTIVNSYAYGKDIVAANSGTITNSFTNIMADAGKGETQFATYAPENRWTYGKVAYDLNGFYVGKREKNYAQEYVNALYRNGDYQYAYYNTTAVNNGSEYLRTNPLVNYGGITTYHNTAHTVDASRATYESKVFKEYVPLFNESAVGNTEGAIKNDYLFFGQRLQKGSAVTPVTIVPASHLVSDMTNRVWRAYGYMKVKNYGFDATAANTDPGFYFNRSASVYNPLLTAINFNKASNKDLYIDMPASLSAFNVDAATVTHNLLVYSNEADNSTNVLRDGVYADDMDEASVLYHTISNGAESQKTIANLHIVDRHDFNAPIAFNVTNRVWYDRNPKHYVTANGNNAWEGLCLPFAPTAVIPSEGLTMADGTKVTNLTHFYGIDQSSKDPEYGDDILDKDATHNNGIGHYYWLRELTAVATEGGKTAATFTRPDGPDYVAYRPYIVSFPGEDFYEFNLAGQTITFSKTVTALAVETIAVTDDATTSVEQNDFVHAGAFLNADAADGLYVINPEGTAFTEGATVPFRTTLNQMLVSPAKPRANIVYIGSIPAEAEAEHDILPEFGDEDEAPKFVLAVDGNTVIVTSAESIRLPLRSVSGASLGMWNIPEGTTRFTIEHSGVYLLGNIKFMIK